MNSNFKTLAKISQLTQKLQLTTEVTEKYIDNKRKTTCFYSFLCALFFLEMNLAIRKLYKKSKRPFA